MLKRLICILLTFIFILGISAIPASAEQLARPTGLAVSVADSNPVISWRAVDGAEKYRVFRLNPETGGYRRITETTRLTYTDTAVKSNQISQYRIRAIDKDGNAGAASAVITTIGRPSDFKVTNVGLNSATFSWNGAANAKDYIVEYAYATGDFSAWSSIDTTAFAANRLKAGTTYRFRIRPRHIVNDREYFGVRSAAVTIKTQDIPVPVVIPNIEEEVLELVNKERAKAGLSPLRLDSALTSAAEARAREAAISFSHTRPNGSKWSTVLGELGINWTRCGENIASGQKTAEQVVKAWMDSAGHRNNIMSEHYIYMGLGKSGTSWAQLFKT